MAYELTTIDRSDTFSSFKILFEDNINFSECPHAPVYGDSISRLNTKGIYTFHIRGDNIVRFTAVNFIYSQGGFS